jgi:outer membrane immunogenic protein
MSNRLITKFLGCAFVVAASGVAFAADMAVKAPPPAPAPVPTWTGWYAGVNVGASFGDARTDFSAAPVTLTATPVGGPGASTTFPGAGGLAGSDTESPSGFMGGGQIGYNWQYSHLIVVGLEADFQGALERDSNTLTNPFSFAVPTTVGGIATPTGTAVTNYSTQIDWFGTVRGRIGYVWGNGNVLSYVTGGLAYGRVDLEGTNSVSGTEGVVTFSVAQALSHSQVNAGWVVGYGTEGKLLIPGWTLKAEALYMDLGTNDTTGVTSISQSTHAGVLAFSGTGGQLSTHSHFTDGILRVGLNYQFH